MGTPRLNINLEKIAHNFRVLSKLYGSKNISVCAVTKVVCSDLFIAKTLVKEGITMIADSKIANLRKMREEGTNTAFLLIGTPLFSQAEEIVKWSDISSNSELLVIKELGRIAVIAGVTHQIILMVELGDLREGIMPDSLDDTVSEIIAVNGIKLIGLGTNLACLNGIRPNRKKMDLLSCMANQIEQKFHLSFRYISGGNSANYEWFKAENNIGKINHLRIGESLFLGVDPSSRLPLPNLHTDIFTLITEIAELKTKPNTPFGDKGMATFGYVDLPSEKTEKPRAILGIGRQDVDVSGLTPILDIEILGSGSDHIIIDPKNNKLGVGDEISFNLNYAALLSVMTSPYVQKITTHQYDSQRIL